MTAPSDDDNPLLKPFSANFGLPPFGKIRPEHFGPAFAAAMAENERAIAAILAQEMPTFANTIEALEIADATLHRVSAAFFHLCGVDTNDALQAIEREMAPKLSRHASAISLNAALFARVDTLWRGRDAIGLNAEQKRLLDRVHTQFVRAGAALDEAGKERLAAIAARLAELGTLFSQNVLADERAFMLVLEGEADMAGLPEAVREAAAEAANERGLEGKHVITLSRSSIEPFLQFSARRDLREKAFAAWIGRGENEGPRDNRKIISEMIALRGERAKLLGYETFAHYRLADTMAKAPDNVRALLTEVWEPARARAAAEAHDLQELVADEGGNFTIAAWDWRYYADHLRKRRFDFDEAELKPYLQLDNMIAAAFFTAASLFGLSFEEVRGLDLYNADVKVWRVRRAGRDIGLFLGDYFARPS
jgi:peptidyl-dipeptidase Dcp